jgi:hypothetical protein
MNIYVCIFLHKYMKEAQLENKKHDIIEINTDVRINISAIHEQLLVVDCHHEGGISCNRTFTQTLISKVIITYMETYNTLI